MFEQVDWQTLFVPHTPILEIVVRGTLIYLSLFLLRVILKRESGTLGITDMLLVVLLADALQNGIHFLLFNNLIKPGKLLLVKNGTMLKENMRKELITYSELMSEVRSNGLPDLTKIKEAYMEPSGRISIISFEETGGKKTEKVVV